MKQKIIFMLLLFCATNTFAQDGKYKSSIGLSLGLPVGLNYKTFIGDKAALDFVGGIRAGSGFSDVWVTGLYEYHVDLKSEGAKFYFGGGASVLYSSLIDKSHLGTGVNGNLGLEYKFPGAPFVFAVDWSPIIWLQGHNREFDGKSGAIKIRYVLN